MFIVKAPHAQKKKKGSNNLAKGKKKKHTHKHKKHLMIFSFHKNPKNKKKKQKKNHNGVLELRGTVVGVRLVTWTVREGTRRGGGGLQPKKGK